MRISQAKRWRCGGLVLLLTTAACVDNGGGFATSETNWLQPCVTDAECAWQYACLCGLCMLPCASAAQCANDIDASEVLPPNDPSTLHCAELGQSGLAAACVLGTAYQPAVCLPVCDDETDCAGYGAEEDGLVCVDGVCVNDRRPAGPGFDVGDDNNAPDQAIEVELVDASAEWFWLNELETPFLPGESSVRGRLDPEENPAGEFDRDYYRFSVGEGTWVAITTTANVDRVGLIDTVVTLYDDEGSLLATNNNAVRGRWGSLFDSELVVFLPPGSYVIEIADAAEWNEPGDYRLGVGRIRPETSVLFESETGDDEASATDIPPQMGALLLLGTFSGADDVDVFRLPQTPRSMIVALRMPPGINGHGGPPLRMWLTEEGSAATSALVDGERGELVVPARPGRYLLWVAPDGLPTGTLQHYVIKHWRRFEPAVLEADDSANDTPAGAEPLPDDAIPRPYMVSRTPFVVWLGDGDVDYFSFQSFARVDCSAWRDGSGVIGLQMDICDANDNVVEPSVPESIHGPPTVLGTESSTNASGDYYLRFTKGGQDPLVTGEYVRCWVE